MVLNQRGRQNYYKNARLGIFCMGIKYEVFVGF